MRCRARISPAHCCHTDILTKSSRPAGIARRYSVSRHDISRYRGTDKFATMRG